jgi:hypothetical protein
VTPQRPLICLSPGQLPGCHATYTGPAQRYTTVLTKAQQSKLCSYRQSSNPPKTCRMTLQTNVWGINLCILSMLLCTHLTHKIPMVTLCTARLNIKQDTQYKYNVTMRRVRESWLPWKSKKYYLLICVCVRACVRVWLQGSVGVCMRVRACSLANPARNAHAPYCDVICGPSVSTTFFDIISQTVRFSEKRYRT